MWLFEEPLFFNKYTKTQTLQSDSLRTKLKEAGCTKLGHLMKVTGTSMDAQRKNSNITSIRLFNRVVEEVCASLPQPLRTFAENRTLCDQWSEGCEYSFPSLTITPVVGNGRKEVVSYCLLQPPT